MAGEGEGGGRGEGNNGSCTTFHLETREGVFVLNSAQEANGVSVNALELLGMATISHCCICKLRLWIRRRITLAPPRSTMPPSQDSAQTAKTNIERTERAKHPDRSHSSCTHPIRRRELFLYRQQLSTLIEGLFLLYFI